MLASDLRNAVESGEFLLEYQPLVDVRTQRVVGVEALVRWHAPGARPGRARPSSSPSPSRSE